MLRRLNQSGDTIVEVLIAVAVLSSTLGMAYATINRNIVALRNNQERTESSKLAQGQIEALIGAWRTDKKADVINAGTGAFCIDGLEVKDLSIGAFDSDDSNNDDITDFENEGCTSTFYRYAIERQSDDAETSTYRIYVRWSGTTGIDTDNQVEYSYKISKVDTP